jgi:hypothetical protein
MATPYIYSEEQIRRAEDQLLIGDGFDPKLVTEDMRRDTSDKRFDALRLVRSHLTPGLETKSSLVSPAITESIKTAPLEQKAKLGALQSVLRIDDEEAAANPDYQPIKVETWLDSYDNKRAALSRDLLGADIYSESKRESSAVPRERQNLYLEAPPVSSVLDRQVSVPDIMDEKGNLTYKPKVEYQKAVDDSIIADAGKDAVKGLRDYLSKNKEGFSSLSSDAQAKEIWNVLTSLSKDMSGNGAKVLAGASDEELEANSIFGHSQTGSTIPEISEAGSEYLRLLRKNLRLRKKDQLQKGGLDDLSSTAESGVFVNDILGQPQWWQDPEMKKQMLSRAPEFEGMLGFGVHKYPSGATIESDPAYVARMIAAPANAVIGGIYGGIAEALPSNISDSFLEERKKSGAADVSDSMSWYDRTVTHALDNVAKNRAIAEEAYDLAGAVTESDLFNKIPGADSLKPIIKDLTYLSGLATDIIAVPIVPGAGLVGKIGTATKEAYAAEKALAGLSRANKLSVGEHVIQALGTGPIDMRLLVATKLADASVGAKAIDDAAKEANWAMNIAGDYERAGEGAVALRNQKILQKLETSIGKESSVYKEALAASNKGEDILVYAKRLEDGIAEGIVKSLDDSVALTKKYIDIGDRAFSGSEKSAAGILQRSTKEGVEDITRWAKTALSSSPDLADLLKGSNVKGLRNIVTKIMETKEGRAAFTKAIADEHALAHVFSSDPSAGRFFLLTDKTAVSSRAMGNKILADAAKTPVSVVINEAKAIEDAELKSISGSKRVISGGATTSKVVLSDEGKEIVADWIRMHLNDARMQNIPLENMLQEVLSGTVSTQTARKLVGLQIDEVARVRTAGKISSIGESTISKMDAKAQNELLKPIVLREGLVRKFLKERAAQFNKVDSPISANAQKILNNIQQEMSSMEKTLRIKIQEIINDPAVAKAYGLEGKITEREAMLALIFQHPKRAFSKAPPLSHSMLEEAFRRKTSAKIVANNVRDLAIHNLPIRASLSDWFRPININLKSYLERIPTLNSKLDSLTEDLTVRLEEALTNEDAVNIVKQYIVDVNKIGTPYVKEGFAPISPDRIEELLSAIYFNAEKDKILEYNLIGLMDLDKPSLSKSLRTAIDKHTVLTDEQIRTIIGARTAHIVSVNAGEEKDYINVLQDFMDRQGQDLGWAFSSIMKSKDGPRFMEAIDNLAFDVIDNYGMAKADAGDYVEWLEGISNGTRKIDPILGDVKTVETIKKIVGDSFDASKFKEYFKDLAKRDANTAARVLGRISDAIGTLRNTKYTFMLNLRPRFHGMNFLTAPFIMMSTIGGEATASAMKPKNWMQGAWLSALSSDTMGGDLLRKTTILQDSRLNAVAFVDVAGRAYTYRDLADIVSTGGILKSQKGLSSAQEAVSKANKAFLQKGLIENMKSKNLIPSVDNAIGNIVDATSAFAEWSDGAFRSSVLIDSLKKGEDVSQALQKAREALFDYGKMSDFEKKYINSWMAFYSFQRAAAINVLTNLVENPTRLANQMKLTKGYVWGEHDRKTKDLYEKEYTQSRPLWKIIDGVDKERYASYLPGMPVADSVFLLSKVFFALWNRELSQAFSLQTDRMDPLLKAVTGGNQTTKKMVYDQGYIDPRDIAWMKATGTFDNFEALFGQLRRDPAKPGEPSWGGMKYSMKDNGGNVIEKMADGYWFFKNWVVSSTIGGDTILKDFAPLAVMINPADVTEKGIDLTTSPWEQLGVTTDIRIDSPTEIYTKKTQDENYKLETLGVDNKTRSTN